MEYPDVAIKNANIENYASSHRQYHLLDNIDNPAYKQTNNQE